MTDFATTDEEQEFSQFVDALEDEGEQVMAEADRVDQQAKKQAQAKKAEHEDDGVVTKTEYMADKFLASASEEEARLFAIYRRGDEDPRQLKAIMELAQTKAAEAEKVMGAEVEEKAEKLADEKAATAYGVGPITPGQPSRKMTAQEEFDALALRARQEKDTHISFALWNALPGSGEVSNPD